MQPGSTTPPIPQTREGWIYRDLPIPFCRMKAVKRDSTDTSSVIGAITDTSKETSALRSRIISPSFPIDALFSSPPALYHIVWQYSPVQYDMVWYSIVEQSTLHNNMSYCISLFCSVALARVLYHSLPYSISMHCLMAILCMSKSCVFLFVNEISRCCVFFFASRSQMAGHSYDLLCKLIILGVRKWISSKGRSHL